MLLSLPSLQPLEQLTAHKKSELTTELTICFSYQNTLVVTLLPVPEKDYIEYLADPQPFSPSFQEVLWTLQALTLGWLGFVVSSNRGSDRADMGEER